jgi:hypothetical protein
MFKMSVVISNPFDVDCPEPLQNLLHRPGFALMEYGFKTPLTTLFA